ncbi:hypothetical protein L2E82_14306 [Cichorium intybus]|uniref:Uncharacterized protein n=1 Tax=Cichorium intybus TaxID=13427 RepID=A0ACB9EZK7_CICIN|nr:hypothetical protein L2E82_14306 [Cichorium intybus]
MNPPYRHERFVVPEGTKKYIYSLPFAHMFMDGNVLFAVHLIRFTQAASSPIHAYNQAISDLEHELDHLKAAFETISKATNTRRLDFKGNKDKWVRSFRDVVSGRLKEDNQALSKVSSKCISIPSGLEIAYFDWLGSCLIGELKDVELLAKCFSIFHSTGIGECSVIYLGGLSVLLIFENHRVASACFSGGASRELVLLVYGA